MSTKWETVPLGEVVRHRKEFVTIDDLEEYKRCRVQLHAKGVVLRDIVPGAEIKTKKQQVCRAGEFLVAEIDAKVGGFGIVPEQLEGAIVSSHYYLFEIDPSRLDRRYLGFFVKTPAFRDQVTAQGSTNYASVRPHDVLSYTIPLPPLPEQRRIVARVEELAAKIREVRGLRRLALDALNALTTSLHLKLAGNRTVQLSDVLALDEEHQPVTPGQEYRQVGIKAFGQGLFAKETLQAEETTYQYFNRLFEGSIVLSQVKGWEGAIAGCAAEFSGRYVSPEYRTFRCIPGEGLPEYFRLLVATPWFYTKLQALTRGVGARRERIRPERFLSLELPMPTEIAQRQILSILREFRPLRNLHAQTAAELDALLPSVLDRAFRGELV